MHGEELKRRGSGRGKGLMKYVQEHAISCPVHAHAMAQRVRTYTRPQRPRKAQIRITGSYATTYSTDSNFSDSSCCRQRTDVCSLSTCV